MVDYVSRILDNVYFQVLNMDLQEIEECALAHVEMNIY